MGLEFRQFSEVLRAAANGDPGSVEAILARYMPLIDRQSVLDGNIDEDLRQYIIMRVIIQLRKFNTDALK
jgi:hypothetical protein